MLAKAPFHAVNLGASVGISGDSIVISAPRDFGLGGSIYFFAREEIEWNEQTNVNGRDLSINASRFGFDVAISGDTAVVSGEFFVSGGEEMETAYIFRVADADESELRVFDSSANPLANDTSATPLAGQLIGTSLAYSFALTNAGEVDLDLQSITLGGPDMSEFSLTVPDISSAIDLTQSQSLDLIIIFSPSGESSFVRNATVTINSDDSNNPIFSFDISGLGLSNSLDGDGDDLNDWAEYSLRELGFDWTTPQPDLVSVLFSNASTAGLFTQSEVAAITGSAVLNSVDAVTNTAALMIELQESATLEGFTPLIADPSRLSVDGDGRIRYEVAAPPGKKFFRAEFKP